MFTTRSHPNLTAIIWAALLLACLAVGCSSPQLPTHTPTAGPTPTPEAVRLQGNWLGYEYHAELPSESGNVSLALYDDSVFLSGWEHLTEHLWAGASGGMTVAQPVVDGRGASYGYALVEHRLDCGKWTPNLLAPGLSAETWNELPDLLLRHDDLRASNTMDIRTIDEPIINETFVLAGVGHAMHVYFGTPTFVPGIGPGDCDRVKKMIQLEENFFPSGLPVTIEAMLTGYPPGVHVVLVLRGTSGDAWVLGEVTVGADGMVRAEMEHDGLASGLYSVDAVGGDGMTGLATTAVHVK